MELPLPDATATRPTIADVPKAVETSDVIPERRWRELERANILRALTQAEFRMYGRGGAAELLGINAATLASRLKKMGIQPRDHRRSRTYSPSHVD